MPEPQPSPNDTPEESQPIPPVAEQKSRKVDEGPGWLPAILAATCLMGIAGFIFCGFSTWVLFQKRTEFAVRTIRGAYIPELEQSLLNPDEKAAILAAVGELADDMERGKYENWQSAGILQRLQRMPVIQWGELQAIESFLEKNASPDEFTSAQKQLSRLRRAVEKGRATSFDFEDVLGPVYITDPNVPAGHTLMQPLDMESVRAVIERAELIADRSDVDDALFPDVRIDAIVREQIDAGGEDGGF